MPLLEKLNGTSTAVADGLTSIESGVIGNGHTVTDADRAAHGHTVTDPDRAAHGHTVTDPDRATTIHAVTDAEAAGAARPHHRPHIALRRSGPAPDEPAARRAVTDLLRALGRDPGDEHLADTPRRVAAALIELTTPVEFNLTTFPNDAGYDELVLATGIPIHSLCEHHLLPFSGVAHIGYLPGERILGLSKLARVAEMFARDLQVQERLTAQIADWLQATLDPVGVGVVIEAEHTCMTIRGVHASGSRTVTSALRGALRTDDRYRQEFLAQTRCHG